MENAADKYRARLSVDATDDRIWANRAACFSRLRRFDGRCATRSTAVSLRARAGPGPIIGLRSAGVRAGGAAGDAARAVRDAGRSWIATRRRGGTWSR